MHVRNTASFSFKGSELGTVKHKMLNWLRPFSIFAYFDNNRYAHEPNRFEMLVGAGSLELVPMPFANGDWLFGHIAYDYKNQIEQKLLSKHPDTIGFKDNCFFQPQIVLYIPFGMNEVYISCATGNPSEIWTAICNTATGPATTEPGPPFSWKARFNREDYIATVQTIRDHIEEGDCYELNLCTEVYAESVHIDPHQVFRQLNELNPAPFAALYRNEDVFLICASPERFIYKEQQKVWSQPIKGTASRSADPEEDEVLKIRLLHNEKERAENVMIVDLVRNDLAKSCVAGSITVPELFGVYSFPHVHQLISTVCGNLKAGLSPAEVITHAFPMGSMTGAPKVKVMELIERYERSRRGLYSGTVGYITPSGDFDFNVVIRSLLYNSNTAHLSYQTGGAITYDSVPEMEWEEVRLKAKAMEQVFL